MLEWSPKLALSGMIDKKNVVNATERNIPPTESSTVFSPPPEETDSAVSMDAGTDGVVDNESGVDDMPAHDGSSPSEEI